MSLLALAGGAVAFGAIRRNGGGGQLVSKYHAAIMDILSVVGPRLEKFKRKIPIFYIMSTRIGYVNFQFDKRRSESLHEIINSSIRTPKIKTTR